MFVLLSILGAIWVMIDIDLRQIRPKNSTVVINGFEGEFVGCLFECSPQGGWGEITPFCFFFFVLLVLCNRWLGFLILHIEERGRDPDEMLARV